MFASGKMTIEGAATHRQINTSPTVHMHIALRRQAHTAQTCAEKHTLTRTSHTPVQVDTTQILFICGGAFTGLDRQVAQRLHAASIGFGAPVRARSTGSAIATADERDALGRVRLLP